MFLIFFMCLEWAFLANSLAIYDDLQPGIFLFLLILGNVVLFFPKIVFFFFFFNDFVSPIAFWYSVTKISQAQLPSETPFRCSLYNFFFFFFMCFLFWGENFTVWHFSALVFCVHLSTYSIYWVFLLLCIYYYYY